MYDALYDLSEGGAPFIDSLSELKVARTGSRVASPINRRGDLGDSEAHVSVRRRSKAPTEVGYSYSNLAITCGDAGDFSNITTIDVVNEIINTTTNISEMFGTLWFADYVCHKYVPVFSCDSGT